MRYEITEGGIRFYETEPPQEQPITQAEVMAAIHRISAEIEALDCECVRQVDIEQEGNRRHGQREK